jgi:hypothetical protein
MPSDAFRKFEASLVMDYDKWHDGIGYDLDALRQLEGDELEAAERLLRGVTDGEWRVAEALAVLKSESAEASLREMASPATSSASGELGRGKARLRATEELYRQGKRGPPDDVIADLIRTSEPYQGLTQALDLCLDFPTRRVKAALLWASLHNPDARVHAAAMLYHLYGKTNEPFDWKRRPFFLKFNETEKTRRAAFEQMVKELNIEPGLARMAHLPRALTWMQNFL